jgi:hypothetical protein
MRSLLQKLRNKTVWGAAPVILLLAALPLLSTATDPAPNVTLDAGKTSPRSVEPLTQRSILRDYRFAWSNLAQAVESNSTQPLNGLFVGTANTWLTDAIESQRRNGLASRYSNQRHHLQAVFYAPEGDLIELHDSAEYDLEILDGGKTIHSEHASVRYVVLMTPAADRWVIRQMQSVAQF